MQRGFIYLAAVMDWATRRVLAWRVSNTLTAEFCVEAVEEAITRYGKPEIFNTDQGTQFTSDAFTTMLHGHGVAISISLRHLPSPTRMQVSACHNIPGRTMGGAMGGNPELLEIA